MNKDKIIIKGARVNNLKNINSLRRNKIKNRIPNKINIIATVVGL